MKKESRIGVFGGAFNPPTKAHTGQIAELLVFSVAGELFFDEIWIVPCGDYRPDKLLQATAQDRLAMMKLALQSAFASEFFDQMDIDVEAEDERPDRRPHHRRVRIKTTEIDRGCFIPTAELWRNYFSQYPSKEFWILIGEDQFSQLHLWHEAEFLFKNVPFFVIPRPGYSELNVNDGESVATPVRFQRVIGSNEEALFTSNSLWSLESLKVRQYQHSFYNIL